MYRRLWELQTEMEGRADKLTTATTAPPPESNDDVA